MKRLTKTQKKAAIERTRFWVMHSLHWFVAAFFLFLTFTTLYAFWGNDQAFAAVIIGSAF